MADFTKRAFSYYQRLGYTPVQAAALAGNAYHESGGDPLRPGDNGKAFGLFQWHPDRKAGLFDFAKGQGLDPENEETQLAYAHNELNGPESKAGKALKSATTLQDANNAVLGFLRPSGYSDDNPFNSHGYVNRYNQAAPLVDQQPLALAPLASRSISDTPAPPSVDQAGAGDADLAGYGSMAAYAADPAYQAAGSGVVGKDWAGILGKIGKGLGTGNSAAMMQAGEPQAAPAAPMIQAQAHRPDMQGGLLNPFAAQNEETKRRLYGLLGMAL